MKLLENIILTKYVMKVHVKSMHVSKDIHKFVDIFKNMEKEILKEKLGNQEIPKALLNNTVIWEKWRTPP